MIDFIQCLVSGIAVGSTYALMGLAMVVIYKTSEVVNFAQGEMALVSSYFTFMILETYGFSYLSAFIGAILFSVLLGFLLEFAVLRRAKESNVLSTIIITIGLEMILIGFVSWKFGADPQVMPFPENLPLSPYESNEISGVFFGDLEFNFICHCCINNGYVVPLFQILKTGPCNESNSAEYKRCKNNGYPD